MAPEVPTPTPLPLPPQRQRGISWKYAWVAVLLVALAVTASWLTMGAQDETPEDPTSDIAVAGFAEDFVFAFVTSGGEQSEDMLSPFLGYTPEMAGMQPGSFYATHVTVSNLFAREHGWDVVVSVDLLERTERGFVPTAPLSFGVRVVDTPGAGLRAETLPTPVASVSNATGAMEQEVLHLPDDASTAAVAAYVDWYLTQTTPIAGLVPTGGFADTELLGLDIEGDKALAAVLATTASGHKLRLDLPLVMQDGNWAVSDFSPSSN